MNAWGAVGWFVLSVALALASAPVLAAPNSPVKLVVLPQNNSVDVKGQASAYDAGAINPLDTDQITHTFQLKNESKSPVLIDDLTSSCGCTTAVLMAGGRSQPLPVRLAPGQTIGIQMQVSVVGDLMDSVDKYVWVHVEGQDDPPVTLEIKATFPPLVVLSPTTLDFGHVRAGTGKQLTVIAEVSPLLPPTKTVVTLTGGLSFLEVGPPLEARYGAGPAGAKGDWRRLKFTVGLDKDAPLGSFAADLTAHITRLGVLGQASGQDLANTYVVARGSVEGDFVVSPGTLIFGTVSAGHMAEKSLAIKGLVPGILAGLSVMSDDKRITISPDSSPAADTSVYRVVISSSAPAGVLQTSIIVTAQNGQTQTVPVLAYVTN
ncbi:MAG TPA: DUF1573 domain-containing protein [Capsulimonadaceae bacterium]|nr:DUF1573 domain-containing protein [Capsulimonadaceae bacterium]